MRMVSLVCIPRSVLTFALLMGMFFIQVSPYAVPPKSPVMVNEEFDVSQMLGEWHDLFRTTYIWGEDTWASQRWSFVQGEDGTVLALFNAWEKSSGACTKTFIYAVEREDGVDSWATLSLEGDGDKIKMWLEERQSTHMVVSLCFSSEAAIPLDCPQDQYQVSVLSRTPKLSAVETEKALNDLPPTEDVSALDGSMGKKPCPTLFISPELVTAELATNIREDDVKIQSIVAVKGSRVKLQCSSDDKSDKIYWAREENGRITITDEFLDQNPRYRLRQSRTQPRDWELRIRAVSVDDAGVFACLSQQDEVLSRVVLSVAEPPLIIRKSDDVGVAVGLAVELECEASGQPAPSISWFKSSTGQLDSETFVVSGNRLLLENFTAESEGLYVCQASNGFDPDADAVVTVRALPEIILDDPAVSAYFGDSVELTCQVKAQSLTSAVWQKGGKDVASDKRHNLDLSVDRKGMFILTLTLQDLNKKDFGEYKCFATNLGGSSEESVMLTEQTVAGELCFIDNIPVMPDFSIQKFLGSWERMQATTYFWGNKTYLSEVVGHFITISGSLFQYHRGYDQETERCLEPGVGSMVLLENPGDYLVPLDDRRGRFKVVYTDYTHAVVYFCLSGDGQRACPKHLLHVQIMSRLPVIPEGRLRLLYRYVQSTCVPVSDLIDTVPGLCQMPAEFLYERGYIGQIPAPNCQVANLQVQEGMAQSWVSGAWHLVGVVKPKFAYYRLRSSVHIVPMGSGLAVFYRGFDSSTSLCTSSEAVLLHMSDTPGSYFHDYKDLTKSITVDSKFLHVSNTSLVLYTCLAVQLDGSCYPGSELVELYHRTPDISDMELLWLKRPLVQACVDIGRMTQPPTGDCTVPVDILSAADEGLLKNDHTLIGCHHSFINTASSFSEEQFAGTWITVHRTGNDMAGNHECTYVPGDASSKSCGKRQMLSEFSKTTEILRSADGRLLLLSRHYNSTWQSCPPTEVIELTQNGEPGSYTFTKLSRKGSLKVVYQDNATALVYWCHGFDSDGICLKKSLVVEILTRSPETPISEEKFHTLKQLIVNLCVGVDDIMPTSQSQKCTVPEKVKTLAQVGVINTEYDIPVLSCQGELLHGMAGVDAEKLVGEWNVRWRKGHLRGGAIPSAESSYIVVTYTGILYLWRMFDNTLDQCRPEEAGQFVRTSGPGDYYSGFDGWPVAMKILYTDTASMLVLWCHVDSDAQCHPQHTTALILSRDATINATVVEQMMAYLDTSCLDEEEWVESKPDVCKVENDVLTAAYIDKIGLEYSHIGCRKDLIQGQQAVTDDMVTGRWTSILWSRPDNVDNSEARATFHFIKLADGQISVLYRLYNAQKAECLPSILMSLQRETGADTASFTIGQERVMKILYAEPDIMAALVCLDFLADDTCDPTTQIFVLLVREGSDIELDKPLLEKMKRVGAGACIAPGSLIQPSAEACPIPEDILRDATSGELEADFEQVQCLTQYIPTQKDFDVKELLGAWYTQWETEDRPSASHPIRSAGFHFVMRQDGALVMLYAPENPSVHGTCLPTHMQVLEVGERSGEFTFSYEDSQALLKIVWLDDENAITYWCFRSDFAGLCEDVHLSVLLRQPDQETDALPFHLLPTIADCCVSKTDLINVNTEGCTVPDKIVQAVEDENMTIEVAFSVIQCAQEFIPVVEDFDMELFSGLWHTVKQTKFMWGNATWDSLLRSFVAHANGSALMAFTGQQKDTMTCVPTEVHTLHPTDVAGKWTYMKGDRSVLIQVVWTDYVSSALLYTCSQVGADGVCERESLQVEYLSRSPQLQTGVEGTLTTLTTMLCVDQLDVQPVETGLCKITIVVEHAAKLRTNEVETDVGESISCRTQDLPLSSNFRFYQMTGYWYEVARTRFTFNQMESIITYYETNPETGNLDGLFIGSLHNHCQSALKSVTKKKLPDGPDSIITGRIQGPESVFPWITFNIIYFDGSFMVHFACYAKNPDGTCPRDKSEVTLLGRSRDLTATMETKLDGLMASVCLTREDLVMTKETDDCLPMLLAMVSGKAELPDTQGCLLDDVKVVANLNEEQLLGTWYGLGSVDYGAQGDPTGFVVSISRSTAQSLMWKQWNIRDGGCEAEKAVYMKATCPGDNSGDYVSTRGSSFMLQWSTLKILRLEDNMMLVYWCTKETDDGACNPEGVRVDLLGRSRVTSLDAMLPLLSSLPSVCLAPENMQPVQTTDACDRLASVASPTVEIASCAVDLLPALSVDREKLSGIWYEMSHTEDPMFPLQKAVTYYKPQPDNQFSMFLAAVGPDGECKGPMEGRMKPQCPGRLDSNFLGRLKFPGMWSWTSWHMLHVDYNTSVIALSCMDEQRDGSCSPQGTKLHILTRDLDPSPQLRQSLTGILRDFGCFSHLPMRNVYHKGLSCEDKLTPVMGPAA